MKQRHHVDDNTCKPASWQIARGPLWRRLGWTGDKANAVLIQCQHGHAYTTVYARDWAGSLWEARIGQSGATGKPLWECL